jgi:hypothetical protein
VVHLPWPPALYPSFTYPTTPKQSGEPTRAFWDLGGEEVAGEGSMSNKLPNLVLFFTKTLRTQT